MTLWAIWEIWQSERRHVSLQRRSYWITQWRRCARLSVTTSAPGALPVLRCVVSPRLQRQVKMDAHPEAEDTDCVSDLDIVNFATLRAVWSEAKCHNNAKLWVQYKMYLQIPWWAHSGIMSLRLTCGAKTETTQGRDADCAVIGLPPPFRLTRVAPEQECSEQMFRVTHLDPSSPEGSVAWPAATSCLESGRTAVFEAGRGCRHEITLPNLLCFPCSLWSGGCIYQSLSRVRAARGHGHVDGDGADVYCVGWDWADRRAVGKMDLSPTVCPSVTELQSFILCL